MQQELVGPGSGEPKEAVGVRFWHDQLFCKPARYGGPVAWHQDYSYWTRTKQMNHMTVHVALDTQTIDNGTLHFVPGSHRWNRNGKPLPITSENFDDMDSIQSVLNPEEAAQWNPQPALLKRGHASFHHPLLVHGSFPNRTDQPRRAAVVNYCADGTWSDCNESLLLGVPPLKKYEQLAGQFFPLVLPGQVR